VGGYVSLTVPTWWWGVVTSSHIVGFVWIPHLSSYLFWLGRHPWGMAPSSVFPSKFLFWIIWVRRFIFGP
jgi:hypothetical protein